MVYNSFSFAKAMPSRRMLSGCLGFLPTKTQKRIKAISFIGSCFPVFCGDLHSKSHNFVGTCEEPTFWYYYWNVALTGARRKSGNWWFSSRSCSITSEFNVGFQGKCFYFQLLLNFLDWYIIKHLNSNWWHTSCCIPAISTLWFLDGPIPLAINSYIYVYNGSL